MITQQRLKELLHYDPETGHFMRLAGPRRGRRAGWMMGNSRGPKYRYIWIDDERFPASHLAYLYMLGSLPPEEMDHIDRDGQNDRWSNLRAVTRRENEWNKGPYRNSKSRLKGVYPDRNRWRAAIRRNGFRVNLGTFESIDEAVKAYQLAAGCHGN